MGTCVSLIFRCDFTHIILLGIKTFIFHGFGVQGQFGWLAHFHKWLITWIWFHHLTTPKIQHRYKPEMILFKYGKFGYLYLFQGGGLRLFAPQDYFEDSRLASWICWFRQFLKISMAMLQVAAAHLLGNIFLTLHDCQGIMESFHKAHRLHMSIHVIKSQFPQVVPRCIYISLNGRSV